MTRTRSTNKASANTVASIAQHINGASKAALPDALPPQLATLGAGIPSRGEWIYEIKFDGYRILTRFDNGKPALITRRGHDWSSRMPQLIAEVRTIGIHSAWVDGEIVMPNDAGVPDFNALQNCLDQRTSSGIVYFLFDLPALLRRLRSPPGAIDRQACTSAADSDR